MKIYVACLASYNNGVLHGKWIDASSDIDEMQKEVSAMLRESRFPNITVKDYEVAARRLGWREEMPSLDAGFINDKDIDLSGIPSGEWQRLCEEKRIEPDVYSSAEEWEIHDYDGIPSELRSLESVAEFVEFIEDNEDYYGRDNLIDLYNCLGKSIYEEIDNLIGIFPDVREYTDDVADEMLYGAPDVAKKYFDYEAFANDFIMDLSVYDISGGVAIF